MRYSEDDLNFGSSFEEFPLVLSLKSNRTPINSDLRWPEVTLDIVDSPKILGCFECCPAQCEYLSDFPHTVRDLSTGKKKIQSLGLSQSPGFQAQPSY
jgi:hypothetical protein